VVFDDDVVHHNAQRRRFQQAKTVLGAVWKKTLEAKSRGACTMKVNLRVNPWKKPEKEKYLCLILSSPGI